MTEPYPLQGLIWFFTLMGSAWLLWQWLKPAQWSWSWQDVRLYWTNLCGVIVQSILRAPSKAALVIVIMCAMLWLWLE